MKSYHWIYFSILTLTAIIGMVRLKKLTTSSKVILLLVVLTILSESTARYLTAIKESNLFIYHLFGPIEASLIIWAFYKEFHWKFLFYLIVGVWVFSIINSLFIQDFLTKFNSNFFAIEVTIVVVLSIIYFYKLLQQYALYLFTDYPIFWTSTGLLIFYLANLVMLGTFNVFGVKNKDVFDFFLQVRILSNYLLYLLIGIGFLSKQRSISP